MRSCFPSLYARALTGAAIVLLLALGATPRANAEQLTRPSIASISYSGVLSPSCFKF